MLSLDNNTTATISLRPVKNSFPGVTVDCLFTGKLGDDDSSLVTVSGCKNGNETTTVSIASSLVPDGLLNLQFVNGCSVVPEDNVKRSFENQHDDVLIPPNDEQNHEYSTKFFGKLPRAVELRTTIWYDQSLLKKFGGSHSQTKQWLAKVLEFAKTLFLAPSLNVRINLKKVGVRETKLTLVASGTSIGKVKVSGGKRNQNNINSFFCHDSYRRDGTIGIAYGGTACNEDGYAVNINEYHISALDTARVFVHELGHNVGME